MLLNLIGFCFCMSVVLFLLLHINASFLSFTQFFTQKENFSARAESFFLGISPACSYLLTPAAGLTISQNSEFFLCTISLTNT